MKKILAILVLSALCQAQNSSVFKNLTVNGTFVVSSSGLSQFIVTSVANSSSTGTTVQRLAKITTSNTAVNATTTDTSIPVFPVAAAVKDARGSTVAAAGTTGYAPLVWTGQASVLFDASGGTVGHFVCVSTTAAANSGIATDCGAGYPAGQCWVGTLAETVGASSVATINVIPGCNLAPAGYATLKNAGTGITARTVINWTSGITCADNGVTHESDCSIGTILAADGSAAAPSISFTNSTGLGFYRFANNQLGITQAGSLVGMIDNSGYHAVSNVPYGWCSDGTCVLQDTALSRVSAGVVSVNGAFVPKAAAIGSLVSCAAGTEGATQVATDCNAGCVAGNSCTTGGATHCQMYCNGSAWVETGR